MADLALSLAKTAVEGTVGRVLQAIDEETKQMEVVQEDLRFIVDEFQMMQSFLKVAKSNKERTSNEVVKTWVRQLRDLAFDVEDCVEFVIHMDTTSARTRVVWRVVRLPSWVWRVVPLPSRMVRLASLADLDQAVAQLKQLKARVEEVSQRNTRYNLLGGDDSGSSTTTSPPVLPEQLDAATFPSTVDILRGLWKANLKQSTSLKGNLQCLVTDGRSNKLEVISVWRSAGVDLEAAHILSAAYCDPEICNEFKARARVKLMHPFNIQEFIKSLLNQLYVTSRQQDKLGEDLLHTNRDSVIQDELRQLLSKHKYLIILEGLSSAVEWDLIRFYLPDLHNGSRIVISTEQLGLSLSCTGEPYRVLQLALFPNDRYIYAFYKSFGIGTPELVKQMKHQRVISLWGDNGGDTANHVRDVYEAMKSGTEKFKGINFKRVVSVDVPNPFSLKGFCQCLPWYSDDSDDPKSYFAGSWIQKVCEDPYLFVIDGLQSKEHWDLMKDAGLVPEHTMSCIIIIANEEAVSQYCRYDGEIMGKRKMDEECQEDYNAAIVGPLFAQKEKYYPWGHDRFGSHGCSRRMEEAISQFSDLITPEQYQMLYWIIWFTYYDDNSDDDDYRVIAVWGASGVGKSALVSFCYYPSVAYSLKFIIEDSKIHEMKPSGLQFERHGWVDVPEPFDLAEFARRLLLDFSSYDPVEMEKTAVGIIQGHNPIQRCYEIIRKYKCQVVIDGLRSTRDWESIKQAFLCHHHKDSCILVISTDESVAKHCATKYKGSAGPQRINQRIIHINALDDTSALELFRKIDNKGKEHIVPKCGGLPKIIDVVAKSDCSFWENTNDDLVTKLMNDPNFGHLRGVFSWMHSYFDGCSDSVKPCVFYLSVFPTNYKIRKTHLLRRWIAEGYCRDTTGSSAKENAKGVFQELVKLGIIQEQPGMPSCQISGFFREYIISQPMEDNLVFVLEGDCKRNSQHTVQHLTIMESWEREQKNVFEMIDISRLRSLTAYGKWQKFFISDNKMKRIRVLDLEGMSGLEDDELKHIFGILLSLKFISLRGCKSVTCLPKTVGGLRQLESLDVRGTSIVTLPPAIIKLQKIKYIRAGMFLPDEEGKSAASGTTPTLAEAKGITNGGIVDTSPPQAQDTEAEDSDGSPSRSPQPLLSQDKRADGAREKTPPNNNNKVVRCWTSILSSRFSCRYPFAATARRLAYNGAGVEVPKGIEDMPALHTLGTVNISSARGKDFLRRLKLKAEKLKEEETKLKEAERLKEVEKLKEELPRLKLKKTLPQITTPPQLLKLSVCGINKGNWKDLCDALLALQRLESLSLGLDEDFTKDSCFENPPRTLKSLEVQGNVHRSPDWIKGYLQENLEKFDLEVNISSQGDLDQLLESLPSTEILRRLCIKLTSQVSKLEFKWINSDHRLRVLKIDCSSQLEVVASRTDKNPKEVDVLIIHCPKGSSFRISSVGVRNGRNFLDNLQTVWLQGYDEKAKYVADLKKEIAALRNKPVFKFEKLNSA